VSVPAIFDFWLKWMKRLRVVIQNPFDLSQWTFQTLKARYLAVSEEQIRNGQFLWPKILSYVFDLQIFGFRNSFSFCVLFLSRTGRLKFIISHNIFQNRSTKILRKDGQVSFSSPTDSQNPALKKTYYNVKTNLIPSTVWQKKKKKLPYDVTWSNTRQLIRTTSCCTKTSVRLFNCYIFNCFLPVFIRQKMVTRTKWLLQKRPILNGTAYVLTTKVVQLPYSVMRRIYGNIS
jgi:hypothetical protein